MLSKKETKQLKQIYREENSKELSGSDALEMGNNLLNLFEVLIKPLSEEELKELKEKMPKYGRK